MKITRATTAHSVLAATALLLAPALPASGSGSGSIPQPRVERQQLTPEQEAINFYNDGISYRDKAVKLETEAASEADAKKRDKLEAKAKDKHEDSIKKFVKATEKNPNLYPAWGSLGYAYRKIGNYNASLEAYGKALQIQPNYTPAIEYRAEAYLALSQLDEVKSAYMMLFTVDRKLADELGAAIEKWLVKRKTDPAGLDPAKLDEFSAWAAQRKQLASQVSSVTMPRNERW
jgi:tetratricopeptide (TPR) repeat protein